MFSHLINISFTPITGAEEVVSKINKVNEKLTSMNKIYEVMPDGSKALKSVQENFKPVIDGADQGHKKTNDFVNALKRAAVVAPVWMATRAAMQLVINTLREGIGYWIDFERAMLKTSAVIFPTAGTAAQAIDKLRLNIKQLSIETGTSMAVIAKTFYEFGQVGIKTEEAWAGTIAATKFAMATQGDATLIARNLAMAQKLLTNEVDKSLSPLQQQEAVAGKIFHLWKENAFESNEFSQSLGNFVATAKIANFSVEQTAVLLASLGTAGVQGARGGTLLRQSIMKLIENLDKLAPTLGLSVNPEMEDTFSVLMRVLDATNELSKTKGIPEDAFKVFRDIFGGTRGSQPIAALNALLPEVKKNLIDMGKDPQKYIQELRDQFESVKDSVPGQIDIFKNYKNQLGEAFVVGIVGGNDFKDALKNINDQMPSLIEGAENFGKALTDAVNLIGGLGVGLVAIKYFENIKESSQESAKLQTKIFQGLQGQLNYGQLIGLRAEINNTTLGKEISNRERILNELSNQIIFSKEAMLSESEISKQVDKTATAQEKSNANIKNISSELQDQLEIRYEEQKVQTLEAAGVSKAEIAYRKLSEDIDMLVEKHNKLKDASGSLVKPVDEHLIKTLALHESYQEILNLMPEIEAKSKKGTSTEAELERIAKSVNEIQKERLNLMKDMIDKQSRSAQLIGYEESAIIRQEIALKTLMSGEDYLNNSFNDRLRLAQALTKEMDEQEKKSSHIVDLFKISKKFGIDVAQEVAQYLGGRTSFQDLSSLGRRALKLSNPSAFEQEKAAEFFANTGFQFPEAIEKQRKQQRNIQILNQVGIDPIQIYVNIDSDSILSRVKIAISEELDKIGSELNKSIHNQIEQH